MSGHGAVVDRVTYRRILANREFRGLVLAQVLSEVGDNLARVALAVLVLERSDSVFLAALVFVVGYLPAMFGSALLGSLADRLPRKRLLLACDLVRALVVALLAFVAVPGTAIPVLLALLFVVELFTAPFDAARGATLPDVLTDPREYLAGAGLSRVLAMVNQVVGLAAAGLVVHVLSPRWGLSLDSLTFLASYVVLVTTLRDRDAPLTDVDGPGGLLRDFVDGARLVYNDAVRRTLVFLAWGATIILVAPEGVALGYARDAGAADLGGALMAVVPAGAAVGSFLITRLPPDRQLAAVVPLAAAGCVPLLATVLAPPVPVAMVLWFVSGACQAFMIPVIGTVNLVTPGHFRGRVNGLAAAGFSVSTAVAFMLSGVVADRTSPADAVALCGVGGVLMMAVVWVAWPKAAIRRATRAVYTAPMS